MQKKSVAVAMSGGVDSTLAAALLVEEGHEVVGTTLNLCGVGCASERGEERTRRSAASISRARTAARALGIPHVVIDAGDEFRRHVIERFRHAYLKGQTPNPCVECNANVKFGFLLERIRSWGIDSLATGHYARSARDAERDRMLLLVGSDCDKDQSYFLWRLSQKQLGSALFPIGAMHKRDVLCEARSRNLPVGSAAESQDACFVPRGDYSGWLESQVPSGTGGGWFRDTSGRILGVHRGIYRYTVGQRRGLGLAFGEPRYVVRIDPADRSVVLGSDADLWSGALVGRDVNRVSLAEDVEGLTVHAKLRYRHRPAPARLESHPDGVLVRFDSPQRAITPGQSVVFYRGQEVLGGAVIDRVLRGTPGTDAAGSGTSAHSG